MTTDNRNFNTTRRLDPRTDPPSFVDEQLPTKSVRLAAGQVGNRGGRFRAPHGTMIGSYRITGSWRELTAPGTYSLRLTRLSILMGSREGFAYIRHSRTGTADIIHFHAPGQEVRLGAPLEPLYSFGPGTVIFGIGSPLGSAHWVGFHAEGFVG